MSAVPDRVSVGSHRGPTGHWSGHVGLGDGSRDRGSPANRRLPPRAVLTSCGDARSVRPKIAIRQRGKSPLPRETEHKAGLTVGQVEKLCRHALWVIYSPDMRPARPVVLRNHSFPAVGIQNGPRRRHVCFRFGFQLATDGHVMYCLDGASDHEDEGMAALLQLPDDLF